ncbi:MAG TPA: glycosyltransferase [Silvibacterium sp.]|nr:glycosyltransferase [Silvibacterium sp.]
MTAPAISIVVIGRNEGQRLARCLESIRVMRGFDGGSIETIYVDSASTDGSPEVAASFGARVIVLHAERPTAALGRNAGWRAARAEFVLFLDGDTILHPDFVKAALEPMLKDASIIAVWGHRREIHPEASIYNRILDLDWVYAPGIVEFCGGDVLMRRSALEEVGGYDSELIAGEEPEMCRRMRARGYRILHIDHPMTGHDLQMMRWSQYWKRAIRSGHAFAEISQRFRDSDDPSWDRERKRNLVHAGFWMGSFAIAVAASLLRLTILPLVLWVALLVALSLRSAWKSRWKSDDVITLWLYGVHSHLQQIPICIGQLQYAFDQRRGNRRTLIEYKEASGAKTK